MLTQIGEHALINKASPDPAFLKVLPGHVIFKIAPEALLARLLTEQRQHQRNLGFQCGVDRDDFRRRGAIEVESMESQQRLQFINRSIMVINTQINMAVVLTTVSTTRLHNQERRRLLTTAITASPLTRLKRGKHAFSQTQA